MKRFWAKLVAIVVMLEAMVMTSVPVMAACDPKKDDNCANTSILPRNTDINALLKLVVNILVYGLGALAVIGVVIAGILYLTARDNEQQVAKAKTRLVEIVIGLVAWAMLFTLLQWLVPGGVSF